jgi:chromosome segregation ATPase
VGRFDGGPDVLAVVIEPTSTASRSALDDTKRTGHRACLNHLKLIREEFFRSGAGAELIEKKNRVADAEDAVKAAERKLADLRSRWHSAVATDTGKEVSQLEKQIEDTEKQLNRLRVRIPALKGELAAYRAECEPVLHNLLTTARASFEAAARAELGARLAELRAAVGGTILEWVRVRAISDGTNLGADGEFKKLFAVRE